MIEFNHVSYGYTKKNLILDDLTFRVEPGTFTALMGPSGAGKSTILWHIMGELRPNDGEMYCLGTQPGFLRGRKLMKYRRKIGYVPQDLLLLEHHNVYANVNSILCGMGLSSREAAARTKNVLELVGLSDRKKSMPSELSGGERQRLAIARALGIMPKVLLADEPTGNLDPAMSEDIMNLFKQIHEMGFTVLIATHEKDLMTRLGADVLYVERGAPVKHTHADGTAISNTETEATSVFVSQKKSESNKSDNSVENNTSSEVPSAKPAVVDSKKAKREKKVRKNAKKEKEA